MGLFDDILAEYGAPQTSASPITQSLARGLMPQIGVAPPMTRAVPETYQTMTPIEGPVMTPASFTELPAEQQSALTLESLIRQRTQRDLIKAQEEKLRRLDTATAFGLNAADAAALGFGTEIASAIEAPLTQRPYGDIIREYGTAKQRLFETNPIASITGSVVGSLSPMPKVTSLGQLMKVGAAQGALQGAGGAEPTQEDTTSTGILKRALGLGTGAVAGAAAPALVAGVTKGAQALAKTPAAVKGFFEPITKQEADATAGTILKGFGVTADQLDNATTAAMQSDNPLLKSLTPVEMLQNPELSTLQKVAESSSGLGKQTSWDVNKRQINLAVDELNKVVDNIAMDNPQAALAAQDKTQRYIAMRQRELHKIGNQMYEDLPSNVEYSRKDLTSRFGDLYQSMFPASKGQVDKKIQYAFDYLTKRIYQEGGELSKRVFSKAEGTQTKISGKDLVGLRSGLLEAGRDLAESSPEQAKLSNELASVVNEFIQTDSKFGPKYAEANAFWADLMDTFNSGRLKNLPDKKIISPDTVSSEITSNISAWKQWQKQTGYNPKLFREQLAIQFDDFARAGADAENPLTAINAKLKWIDNTGSKLVYGSPADKKIAETFKKAKSTLTFVKDFLEQKKDATELVAPGFTIKDLQSLGADELAQIALTANPKAGGIPTQAFKAAMRQFIRDKSRQGLGRALGTIGAGGLLGGVGGYAAEGKFSPISVISGAAGAGFLATAGFARMVQASRTAQLLNESLTAAMRDPVKMKQVLNAATMAETKAGEAAAKGVIPTLTATTGGRALSSALSSSAGVAAGKTASGMSGALTTNATKQKQTTAKPAGKFDDILAEYKATPTATPTPEPTKEPSLMEKAANFLVSSAWPEENKKGSGKGVRVTIPVGDKYIEASLLRAIIKVESNFKANARSKSGAIGPMQLMPRTAKALGVDPNNIQQNIEAGSRYMKTLLNRFEEPSLAMMAYNWGEGNVAKALRWLQGRNKPATFNNIIRHSNSMPFKIPREAKEYAFKVNAAWDFYKSRG